MSPITTQLGLLTLVSSALAVPFFHHGLEHHRHHQNGRPAVPIGTAGPYGSINASAYGAYPSGTGASSGFAVPSGFAPSPVVSATDSAVTVAPNATVSYHSTVYVTNTIPVTLTVFSEAAPEQKRWVNRRKSGVSTVVAASSSTSTRAVAAASSTSTSVYVAPATSTKASSAAAQTSAATSSTVAVAAGSSSSGKRGLVYNDVSLTNCFTGSNQISWAYNWDQVTSGLSSAFKFVPMLWGTASYHTDRWSANAKAAIASGSTHLLSFNEPDMSTQANLSPQAAAAAYKTYMMPFAGQVKLGAPAVTNGGSGMGLDWLDAFIHACDGCQIDFVTIHWYDSATNIDYFKNHVKNATAVAGGRPVWLTEFGASGSDAQVSTFLQNVMPWMDSQSWLERYSYFMVSDGLLVSGGQPSGYGSTFKSYSA